MRNDTSRYALLIDAENVSSGYIETIIGEIADKGEATIRRIYGNWTDNTHQGWKGLLLQYSITPVQQFNYTSGKNASDSALIIDAMDILYSGNVDGFAIVSSDSDFTRLASRLRESGMTVIGMGERKTPDPFIKACTEFKFLDRINPAISLIGETKSTKNARDRSNGSDENYVKKIDKILEEKSDQEGWVLLSLVVGILKHQYPEFNHDNWGYSKATDYMRSLGYKIKEEKDINNKESPNGKIVYIRKDKKGA